MKAKNKFFEIKMVSRDDVSTKSAETRILSQCVTKFPTAMIPVNLEFFYMIV